MGLNNSINELYQFITFSEAFMIQSLIIKSETILIQFTASDARPATTWEEISSCVLGWFVAI